MKPFDEPDPAIGAELSLDGLDLDIGRLIAEGHTDQEIADALGLPVRSVRTRLGRIRNATGTGRRAEIAALAVRSLGEVPAPPGRIDAATSVGRADRPIQTKRLQVPIGVDESGLPVILDLSEMAAGGSGPHGVIVGATGSGKSELLRSIVSSLVSTHTPSELEILIFDPAGAISDLGQFAHVVSRSGEPDASQVQLLKDRINDRIRRPRVPSWHDGTSPNSPRTAFFPRLLIVVDEPHLGWDTNDSPNSILVTAARRGRSLGIHLLVASQSSRGIGDHLLALAGYRICLPLADPAESVVMLGSRLASSAEHKPGRGFLAAGGRVRQFQSTLTTRSPRTSPPRVVPGADDSEIDQSRVLNNRDANRPGTSCDRSNLDKSVLAGTGITSVRAARVGRPHRHSTYEADYPAEIRHQTVANASGRVGGAETDVARSDQIANNEIVRRRERTPNLIGRESALAALDEGLGGVADAGSLVLVRGEVGIGKTRLLEEFAARVGADTHVVRGGCVEGVSYAPWTESLRRLLSTEDVVAVDDLPRRVRSEVARLLPHLSLEEDPAGGDDSGGQHLLFEAVVELLAHLASRTRLVLVVDDLHWVDPASGELLRYVANNLGRVPILLVVTYRAEDAAAERDLIAQLARLSTRQIALTPLAEASTAEIAEILLGRDASPADIRRIAHDADGNPLFVEELVAALGTTGVPQTVRDLMLARFSALDEPGRHLVRTAAVIGATAPQAWLAAAAGLGDDATREAARAAVDRGLLIAGNDGTSYEFRHALLREAVLDELLPDERVALHQAIAAALTGHGAIAVGIDRIAELARHWDAARDASSALQWLVAAAEQAVQRFAFEAAFDDYERALGWWESVDDAPAVAGIDHAALLLDAADAAGLAGHIGRAADLARAGLDEAYALDASRGVEAAGRVYPLMWAADRAPELFDFGTTTLLPVLDRADPAARARFLVSRVEHLVRSATPAEVREPAAQMMAALQGVNDPVLEARAYFVSAWCHEAYGDFDRVEAEYVRAAEIARSANAPSMLALVLYNHAAFKIDFPDLQGSVALLDEVDVLIERFGLRRYLVVSRCSRSQALSMQGDLAGAAAAMASIDDVFTEGLEAWVRAAGRAHVDFTAGNSDSVLWGLRPDAVGTAAPKDSDIVIETEMLRADALAWNGDLEGARRAVDRGEAAVAAEHYRETCWHGRLAMVGTRVEADIAVAAMRSQSIGAIENAQVRAAEIVAGWETAVGQLARPCPLLDAYTIGIDAEVGRLRREEVVTLAHRAAEAFATIGWPYYATYFRWREAEAMLDAGDRPAATELLKRARATATTHGFAGLDAAIVALARAHQLRLGPARTTVDGDEALSVRELEVLRLVASGKSNPDIAEALFISRRTAAAHVSNILRKLDASSRVEAVSEAHRRALV